MSVSKKDVKYIADLARLEFTEQETELLAEDMNDILGYMEQLSELDTEDVEPLSHVIELGQNLREDEEKTPLDHDEALKNAPDADSDYFRVPKVID